MEVVHMAMDLINVVERQKPCIDCSENPSSICSVVGEECLGALSCNIYIYIYISKITFL